MELFLGWSVFIIAVAVAWVTGMVIWHGMEYDKWEADIRKKGIQMPLHGFTDVSYREIPARKTNR